MRCATVVLVVTLSAASGGAALAAPGRALERSVRAASLVVLAQRGRVTRPAPRPVLWTFDVAGILKGDAAPSELVVDLEKAPVGLWPKRGEPRVLCLAPAGGGVYELASYLQSIVPPEEAEAVRSLVAAAADVARVAVPDSETAKPPATPERVPDRPQDAAAKLMRRRIAETDTILVGTLSGIRAEEKGTVGVFRVQESLLGYGGFTDPIAVRLPGRVTEAGTYVLFLRGSLTDATLSVTSPEWGAVRIADAAQEEKIKASVRAAAGGPRKALTTIHAALAEWQASWNARDLERCMKCYASRSALRREYEEGGEKGRAKLEEQMKSFPGKVALSLQRISLAARPGARAADVTVLLRLAADGLEDSRTATMQLVFEDGEWLILHEGF